MHFSRHIIPSALTFRYIGDKHKDIDDNEIIVYRPRLEIRLSNEGNTFKVAMLIDSGADATLIPLEVAEVLELKLGKEIISKSASGQFKTRASKVNAELLKGGKSYNLGGMDVRVPTEKIEGASITTYALLGRSHFFKKFDITFRERTRKVVLRKPKHS